MAKRTFLEEGEKKKLNASNLKKLLGIFRFTLPYRTALVLGLLSLVLSNGTVMAFPYFAGKLLDVAQGKSDFILTTIPQIGLALIGILFVQSIFSFVRVYSFSLVSEQSMADVRKAVYQKVIWLPQSFFDSRRVGELMSRITSDVSTLQDTFSFTLAELLRQVLILVTGIPLIMILMPKLTLFMLMTFPILVLAALFFGKFIRRLSKKTQDQLADANVIVEETLQSIAVVKSFTNEMVEVMRYGKSLNQMVNTAIQTARFRGLFISFTIFALFGGMVAFSWYGATLVQRHEIAVGDLFSFVLYAAFIGGSIAGLGDIYSQIQRSIGSSERLLEILEQSDEKNIATQQLKLSGTISFQDVHFTYPTRTDFPVLKNIEFEIKPGEKIALVGPSGSGKSTLINLMMRFYEPTRGSLRVDGKDIREYGLSDYRKNIGIVPQEIMLFGGSIGENIGYGKPGASLAEITEAAKKANALEFIDRFPEGMNTLVGDRGVKLSGGQRQRVAIARAILKDPSILVLDEATSSLDAGSERLVQEALEKLMENRTTIVIAHRLSTIRKVDRIMVVKEGQIAETGTHSELSQRENGIYSNLLRMQVEIS